ncbi:hypothetical protein BH09PSE3_BH09PSE3_15510 [soil metagenome]
MARNLASMLSTVRFSHVFTSPRQRARQTALLAGLGGHVEIDPCLEEWDYGDFEGMTSAQIRAVWPRWDVFDNGCPGGENLDDVVVRADGLIQRLRALHGNIALVSHGQFGSVLAARWIGLPGGEGRHFVLAPASISTLGYRPGHPDVAAITRLSVATNVSEADAHDFHVLPC